MNATLNSIHDLASAATAHIDSSNASGSMLMAWSRRFIAVFWVVFGWTLLIGGPWADSSGLDRLYETRALPAIVLMSSAVFVAVTALILRHLARYVDRQVKRLAMIDALTGLPNRSVFIQRLNEVVHEGSRRGTKAAAFFIDVDRFKTINDSLGHAAGDAALIEISNRLSACISPSDLLARFGGDEFVILRPSVYEYDEATRLAQNLIDVLSRPIVVLDRDMFVSASVGIALSHANLTCPDDLLRDADLALYRAKAKGRATYVLYEPVMNVSAVDQFHLETDLWRAGQRGELSLYYQPEFEVSTGELAGFEALIRWNHPVRGLLLPAAFIGLAEENGAVNEIGYWAIEDACRQMRAWQLAGVNQRALEMSVNISAVQLGQECFVERVAAIIDKHEVDPSLLCFEITESVLVQDNLSVRGTLHALKNRVGVKLAIDDFGTGYASLRYLQDLPVDVVKIDQSFINGIEDSESSLFIVQSIVTLAHDLGLRVIAEGVETEGQLALLRRLGCDSSQGFHLAAPLASHVVDSLIRLNSARRWSDDGRPQTRLGTGVIVAA